MSRTGYAIAIAIALALAAAGFFVWTTYFSKGEGQTVPIPQAENIDWSQRMKELAGADGIVASFGDNHLDFWAVTDAHKLERFRISGTENVFARLSSTLPLDPENRLSGLQLKLPLSWAQKVNGRRIEIGVLARQPMTNSANDISMLYATLQAGNSGWQTLQLNRTFAILRFTYDVPAVETGYTSEPTLVLRSDQVGADKAVELVGVYLKLVAK